MFIDFKKYNASSGFDDLIYELSKDPINNDFPIYIVDLEEIRKNHLNWISKLPRVEPFYAVKCNTDRILLKYLSYLGAGFDCASQNEIEKVLEINAKPDKIIFANPYKQVSFLKYAKQNGIDLMTFDDESELYKIKKFCNNAKLVLRIKTNDEGALYRFSTKFGADMNQSTKLIDLCYKLELNLVGISFHVGSGQMNYHVYEEPIKNARTLFDYVLNNYGASLNYLDVGGGFPGTRDSLEFFDKIAKEINSSLEKYFPPDLFKSLKIIAEPGRYYPCSAFNLCVSITSKRIKYEFINKSTNKQDTVYLLSSVKINPKQINLPEYSIDTSKVNMYHVNDGLYSSFNFLLHEKTQCIPFFYKNNKNKILYKSIIWGPTCDSADAINKDIYLPELELGDFLIFQDMGAYTTSCASTFNGMPVPKFIYIADESWDIIKKEIIENKN